MSYALLEPTEVYGHDRPAGYRVHYCTPTAPIRDMLHLLLLLSKAAIVCEVVERDPKCDDDLDDDDPRLRSVTGWTPEEVALGLLLHSVLRAVSDCHAAGADLTP